MLACTDDHRAVGSWYGIWRERFRYALQDTNSTEGETEDKERENVRRDCVSQSVLKQVLLLFFLVGLEFRCTSNVQSTRCSVRNSGKGGIGKIGVCFQHVLS